MFKLIGGAVVYGFALYGVVKALEKPDILIDVTSKRTTEKAQGSQTDPMPSDQR